MSRDQAVSSEEPKSFKLTTVEVSAHYSTQEDQGQEKADSTPCQLSPYNASKGTITEVIEVPEPIRQLNLQQ